MGLLLQETYQSMNRYFQKNKYIFHVNNIVDIGMD